MELGVSFPEAKVLDSDTSLSHTGTDEGHQTAKQSLLKVFEAVITYPMRSRWLLTPRWKNGMFDIYTGYLMLNFHPLRTPKISSRCSSFVCPCIFGYPTSIQDLPSGTAEEKSGVALYPRECIHSDEEERLLAVVWALPLFMRYEGNVGRHIDCISEVLKYEESIALDDY
jgi:hypothetical protein